MGITSRESKRRTLKRTAGARVSFGRSILSRLGSSWDISGRLSGASGPSWGGLGAIWGVLGQSWGDLDIDDVNGFGPETFTSTPGTSGLNYEVKVHYYSDHGNGDTNVTMRVVYYDGSTGELCDISATQSMASYEWWSVGMFGPGLSCPQ
ncbi:MAG: hypothetical protein VX026_06955 [Myxococcota bacterium]|nr:hypothetical protein [Myxococcota bacterium]